MCSPATVMLSDGPGGHPCRRRSPRSSPGRPRHPSSSPAGATTAPRRPSRYRTAALAAEPRPCPSCCSPAAAPSCRGPRRPTRRSCPMRVTRRARASSRSASGSCSSTTSCGSRPGSPRATPPSSTSTWRSNCRSSPSTWTPTGPRSSPSPSRPSPTAPPGPTEESTMDDVAIIGVGLHPFGRFGDKTAFDMGAEAVDLALADAGVPWTDIQFAFGGSWEVAQTDPLTGLLGLTGIPFMNVFNACATASSAIQQTASAIRAGIGDIGVAVGLDKHPRGSFKVDPTLVNMPMWYADNGQYVTTKFFGMKINRYMHDHGISSETLARVAAKNYRNGSLNPKAFRRSPMAEEDILAAPMLNHPLTAAMFCAPDE